MTHYDLLGVTRGATKEQIAKAYRTLAKQWHPDHNREKGAAQKFKEITEAFQTLSDYSKRAIYDAKLPPIPKPVKKSNKTFKSMTDEERWEYIIANDPNFAQGSVLTPKPPKFDIWGRPLSGVEQGLWRSDVIWTQPVIKPSFVKKKDEFIDVFAQYYED